jgi:hypothetical protein
MIFVASAVIHLAVANEINKKLNRDKSQLLIGAIAPDISKFIGEDKTKSHFLKELDSNIPDIESFLNKYKNNLTDDFVMGYFIHLYTDYLWFKYFVTEFYDKPMITKLDGTVVKCSGNMLSLYVYNDYTNLNIKLIDKYNMDLKIFYNQLPKLSNIIEEIPMDKMGLLLSQMGIIIENSKEKKDYIFNIENIEKFITTSVELILGKITEL